ncbi:MAG: hypothetical protein LC792_29635, partial [Actinobacteria bacterium]|nr:hypothetical protein [Actinomycetota bacterium]
CTRGGVVWAYFTGEGAAASHAPDMAYRGDGAGPWRLVMRETMTTPGRLEDPHGGSYPGPLSALGTASAVFVTYTPPADPPVEIVLATDDGGRLTPAQPVPGLRTPTAASFLDDNTGWVLGEGADGDKILATSNGGRSWTTQLTRPVPRQ